jgi:5'-nucleotidase
MINVRPRSVFLVGLFSCWLVAAGGDDNHAAGVCTPECAAGYACSNGSCVLSCPGVQVACDDACVDYRTDRANCGTCGNACDPGSVCSAGVCALSCQPELDDCDDVCVDTSSDRANCGGCGLACDPGEVCSGGECALSCQSTLTECGDTCVDTTSNVDHCGGCESPCAPGQVCSDNDCVYDAPVTLQFVTISDWHGQLDPVSVNNVNVGGAAALATYFQRERAANNNTIILTGGDAFGATPPLSGFFGDEPAVMAMNLMGIQADTFGNHNFDGGLVRLQRLIDLATFPYISSNLANLDDNLTGVVSPYQIVSIGGVDVALIGITNPDAPDLSFPGALGTMTVSDPIEAAIAARAAAYAAGARVFVVFAHLGATTFDAGTGTYGGPLIDFASGVTGFDVIFGDHTDLEVDTVVNNTPVVENRSKGVTYARVTLTVTPSGRTLARSVEIISPVTSAVPPEPAIVALLAPYRVQLAAAFDEVIAVATGTFPRGNNVERLEEVAIGNLLAGIIRDRYTTQLALINGGGIRAPLPSSYLPADTSLRRATPGYADGPPYDLVKGDVYTVLPFGNSVVTRTVTGVQLWAMLENGVGSLPAAAGRFPQIAGFRFVYSASAAPGSRIQSVTLDDGTPIAADATTYTLATIDFINSGGDGYTMLADGEGTTREVMADVVAAALATLETVSPTIDGRITQQE